MVQKLTPQKDDRKVHLAASNRFVETDMILFFYGRLKETGQAKKAAAKAEAAVRKQFKNTGVSLNVFDTVARLAEQDDPDALKKFLDEFLHIAAAFDPETVKPGTQFSMFDGASSTLTSLEKAFTDGRMRGISGLQPDSQAYPDHTDLGQEHLRGWNDGQSVLQQRFMQMNEEARREAAEKEAKAAEKLRKREERAKAAAEKAAVKKTPDGETVQ